jgi:hypothetical protein
MIDISDLVRCSYSMEPNLSTTHNCASAVREVLIRLGYNEAANGFPVLPDAAISLLSRSMETLPWCRIGDQASLVRQAGDIAVTRDIKTGHMGVSVLFKSNDTRVLTALPDHGVRIMPIRALPKVQSVFRPLR